MSESLGGLHVGQVRHGIRVESRTVVDHLHRHVVVGHPAPDQDPVHLADRALRLDGVGHGLGHDQTEVSHPPRLQR